MVNTDSNEYDLSLKALKLFPIPKNLTTLNSLKIKSGFTHEGVKLFFSSKIFFILLFGSMIFGFGSPLQYTVIQCIYQIFILLFLTQFIMLSTFLYVRNFS